MSVDPRRTRTPRTAWRSAATAGWSSASRAAAPIARRSTGDRRARGRRVVDGASTRRTTSSCKSDGTIWFTDPSYGWLQGFRPRPSAATPCTASTRAPECVADGGDSFDKPNGLCFSPGRATPLRGDNGAPRRELTRPPAPPQGLRRRGRRAGSTGERVIHVDARASRTASRPTSQGRVYASSLGRRRRCFDPDGELLGEIEAAGRRELLLRRPPTATSSSSQPTRRSAPPISTQRKDPEPWPSIRTRRIIDDAGAVRRHRGRRASERERTRPPRRHRRRRPPRRADRAAPHAGRADRQSSRVAVDKARTAAIFVRPSREIEEQVTNGRLGALALHGARALTGGIPLRVDGEVVGAIGTSGETPDEDEADLDRRRRGRLLHRRGRRRSPTRARARAAEAAGAAAAARGVAPVISAVDAGGALMYLVRPDAAQVACVEVTTDKARTAAIYRRPSKDFEDQASGGRPSALHLARAVPLQGGVPIDRRRRGDRRDRRERRDRRPTRTGARRDRARARSRPRAAQRQRQRRRASSRAATVAEVPHRRPAARHASATRSTPAGATPGRGRVPRARRRRHARRRGPRDRGHRRRDGRPARGRAGRAARRAVDGGTTHELARATCSPSRTACRTSSSTCRTRSSTSWSKVEA